MYTQITNCNYLLGEERWPPHQ